MHRCAMTAQIMFSSEAVSTSATTERLQSVVFLVDVFLQIILAGRG